MAYCFAIASGKGGVGKSAVTANLGAALASCGHRVVIIDADIGLRSQDTLLSMENRVVYDLIDLTRGDCDLNQALLESDAWPTLRLLPAAQFARAKSLDPKRLRKTLQTLSLSCDYILVDCPAGIERGLRNVLNAGVDEVLLIVTPDDGSVRSAERVVQIMDAKGLSRPHLIVNRLDAGYISSGEMMSAGTVAGVLDLSLVGEIPEDPAVDRSILRHRLFISYDCEARRAVCRIAERLQNKSVPFPAYGSRKPSFLHRFRVKPFREVTPLDDH